MICYRVYWSYDNPLVINMMSMRSVINRASRLMVDNLVVYYLVTNDASVVAAIDVACIIIMMTAVAT
jgi:hypothetical protein